MEAPPGVYIYLGYSKKDALILQRGRVKLGKKVPDTEEEERNEVKNTIQQTVSHFTSNANKVLLVSILCSLNYFLPQQKRLPQLVANKNIYVLHKHFPSGSIQGPS